MCVCVCDVRSICLYVCGGRGAAEGVCVFSDGMFYLEHLPTSYILLTFFPNRASVSSHFMAFSVAYLRNAERGKN